jgi:hypothetical protein
MTTHVDELPTRETAEQKLGISYVRECFELRGSEVYWSDRPIRHFASEHAWRVFRTKYAGKPAGRKDSRGYISIHMRYHGDRVQFQAHRVVWMLHHGRWPAQAIDHINRTRDDNRIENLREATLAENNKNSASRRVHPYVGPHKWGGFQAQVRIGDKNIHLGVFNTDVAAAAHRQMVCAELEKLARNLAKKSKTGRKPTSDQTFDRAHVDGGKQ